MKECHRQEDNWFIQIPNRFNSATHLISCQTPGPPHAHTISHAFILHIPYLWWKPVLLEPRSSRGYKGWEEDGGTPCCLCCRSHRDSIGFVLDKHFQAFISVSTKERLWSTKTLDAQSPFPSHFCVLVFFYLTIFFFTAVALFSRFFAKAIPRRILFSIWPVLFFSSPLNRLSCKISPAIAYTGSAESALFQLFFFFS